jgi:hypothetical protein
LKEDPKSELVVMKRGGEMTSRAKVNLLSENH